MGRAPIRLCLRYLLTVLVVFAAVNLPFLAWHPGAWWHGTLIPLTGGLVADGQGFVTLATHGLTGGVNLTMLSLAGALAMVGGVAAFVAWYPQLKRIWPLLLTVPFFFSPRSLSSYLVDLFPVALVAALSVDGVPRDGVRGRTAWRDLRARPSVLVVAASCVGVVIASFMAFSGPPLQLSVRSVSHVPRRNGARCGDGLGRQPDVRETRAALPRELGDQSELRGILDAVGSRTRSARASRLRDDHVAPAGVDGRAPTRRAVVGRGVHHRPHVAEHVPLGHVPSVVARPAGPDDPSPGEDFFRTINGLVQSFRKRPRSSQGASGMDHSRAG